MAKRKKKIIKGRTTPKGTYWKPKKTKKPPIKRPRMG